MPKEASEEREERRKQPTLVRGEIGVVGGPGKPSLWDLWNGAIERNKKAGEGVTSWRQLEATTNYKRSYIQALCEAETVPYDAFAKICRQLNIDPEKHIVRFKDEVERRLMIGR